MALLGMTTIVFGVVEIVADVSRARERAEGSEGDERRSELCGIEEMLREDERGEDQEILHPLRRAKETKGVSVHRSIRTADSTRSPRKLRPTFTKRSGTSVTKKLVEPFPDFLRNPIPASFSLTSRAVSSAESTRRTRRPRNRAIAFLSSG